MAKARKGITKLDDINYLQAEDVTWDDVMEKVRFQQAVEAGIRAADQGKFASGEDLQRAFKRWGVDVSR